MSGLVNVFDSTHKRAVLWMCWVVEIWEQPITCVFTACLTRAARLVFVLSTILDGLLAGCCSLHCRYCRLAADSQHDCQGPCVLGLHVPLTTASQDGLAVLLSCAMQRCRCTCPS